MARRGLVASLSVLVLAGSAEGAVPFRVDANEAGTTQADAGVDSSGRVHMVWRSTQDGGTFPRIRYCRVDVGATACAAGTIRSLYPVGNQMTTIDGVQVLVTATDAVVVTARLSSSVPAGNYVMVSSDGGATFSGPVLKAPANTGGSSIASYVKAALGPGGALSFIPADGSEFLTAPLEGAGPGDGAELAPTAGQQSGADVASAGSTPVVARGVNDAIEFDVGGTGNLNEAASWTRSAQTFAGSHPQLGGGPTSLGMIYTIGSGVLARPFNGTTFGSPVVLTDGGGSTQPDLFVNSTDNGYHLLYNSAGSLRLRTSTNGAAWTEAATVVTAAEKSDSAVARVAAGPAGTGGVAFWADTSVGVKVARLVPVTTGPTATPTPTPTPSPGPGSGTPGSQTTCTGPFQPARCRLPAKTKCEPWFCVIVGGPDGAEVGILLDACLTDRVKVRLRIRRRKVSGRGAKRTVVKVRKVTFFVDGRKAAVDRKPAYAATLRLRNPRPNSRHRILAKAKVRTKKRGRPARLKNIKVRRGFVLDCS